MTVEVTQPEQIIEGPLVPLVETRKKLNKAKKALAKRPLKDDPYKLAVNIQKLQRSVIEQMNEHGPRLVSDTTLTQ